MGNWFFSSGKRNIFVRCLLLFSISFSLSLFISISFDQKPKKKRTQIAWIDSSENTDRLTFSICCVAIEIEIENGNYYIKAYVQCTKIYYNVYGYTVNGVECVRSRIILLGFSKQIFVSIMMMFEIQNSFHVILSLDFIYWALCVFTDDTTLIFFFPKKKRKKQKLIKDSRDKYGIQEILLTATNKRRGARSFVFWNSLFRFVDVPHTHTYTIFQLLLLWWWWIVFLVHHLYVTVLSTPTVRKTFNLIWLLFVQNILLRMFCLLCSNGNITW